MERQQAVNNKPQSPRFMAAVPDGKFMSLPVHEENSRLWNTRKAGSVQLNEIYSRSKRKHLFRRTLF